MNHMLETQHYFVGSARGEERLAARVRRRRPRCWATIRCRTSSSAREETMSTYGDEDVLEKSGPTLGIAFADQLLHGWDLAKATGQDTTMPAGLAEAAYQMIHGKLTDEQRKGIVQARGRGRRRRVGAGPVARLQRPQPERA